jgi:hypothetical protein
MTWTALKSRGEILREVSAIADERRDGTLPMDADGVRRVFRDELDLIGALQLRWHTRLAGRIERELAQQPTDLESAVVAAWQLTAEELPGIRAIVDHHRAHPRDEAMAQALERATHKERSWLAVMAGQAGIDDPRAAAVGERIEELARAVRRPAPRPGAHAAPRLIDRLRAALAA